MKYSVCRSGVEIGDFEEFEFREKLKAREIVPHDWYWHEGMEGWRRIEEIYPVRPKGQPAMPGVETDGLVAEGNRLYLSHGRGMTEANRGAFRLFLRAAMAGSTDAQLNLGVCYRDGNGVALDYEEAARWFRMAAEQGDPEAQLCLGNCHRLGHGVPQDYGEAVKWLTKAAEQGNADARFNLEVMTLLPRPMSRARNVVARWRELIRR